MAFSVYQNQTGYYNALDDSAISWLVPYGVPLALFAVVMTKLFSKLQFGSTVRIQKGVSWADIHFKDEEFDPQDHRGDIDCPYEYILQVYGRSHFKKIVDLLKPSLKDQDSVLYSLVLELMDSIHFGAILVDDIADNSLLRKGRYAAHHIYGSSETINRAYLRILEVIEKFQKDKPDYVQYILTNLSEIHEGQDISLVWRRDGFPSFDNEREALQAYKNSAYLKTGALFRLVGQLVFKSHEKDELMSRLGWYCHLQNDCKNIYAEDVIKAKGALAEDLENGEYSYPIVLSLYSSASCRAAVHKAMVSKEEDPLRREAQLKAAISALYHTDIKDTCMAELETLRPQIGEFAHLWGRDEKMNLGGAMSTT